MKKLMTFVMAAIFALVNFQAVAQTTPIATSQSPQVNAFLAELKILRQLQQGMTGEDVKTLQAILAAQPDIYPEALLTGYYGPLTTKAVKKYQEKFGISVIGRVGPMTMKKLNELAAFHSAAAIHDNNANIKSSTTTADTSTPDLGCVRIPPGHFIAPGWLKKHGGTVPAVPACQNLPPGIAKKLGWTGTTTPPTPQPVDTTAPLIFGLTVLGTTSTTSNIMWLTNEMASTKFIFGTSTPVLESSATSTPIVGSGLSINHNINLLNLTASTTYYFVTVSADMSGNSTSSAETSFVTLAP